jgi:hypothetical protein
MNRNCDGFQGVRCRVVTSRGSGSGMRVGFWKSKRRGNGKRKKWFRNNYCRNQGGICYCHNLAGPEGGLRARWAQRINVMGLRIGPARWFKARLAMYLDRCVRLS